MTKTMLQLLQIHCAVQSEVQFQFQLQLQLQYSTTCIIVRDNIYSTVQFQLLYSMVQCCCSAVAVAVTVSIAVTVW